jgi:hypothetical protein
MAMARFYIFLGFIMAVTSSFFVIAALSDLFYPGPNLDTEPGILLGLLVFFSLFTVAGGYMFYVNLRNLRRDRDERMEQELLRVIAKYKGRVTPIEVATDTRLSLTEAEQALRRLARRGQGELKITTDGELVYVFTGFIPARDKASAKSALEW